MANKYNNAPISELIFGVIFNNNILLVNSVIFELMVDLKHNFPRIATTPALQLEELQDGKLFSTANYMESGFSTFLIGSEDGHWRISLQQNVFLFHWIREDETEVGKYPGFSVAYKKFTEIVDVIKQKTGEAFQNSIKSYSLYYQDRIILKNYISDLSQLDHILNVATPTLFVDNKPVPSDNIFSKFTIPCKEINGFGVVSVNTVNIFPSNDQLLVVECRLKGEAKGNSMDDWFSVANKVQMSFFESYFKDEILNSWK